MMALFEPAANRVLAFLIRGQRQGGLPTDTLDMTDSPAQYLTVVNPRGGRRRGHEVLEAVTPVFDAAGAKLDVRVTTHAGHARELAQSTDLQSYAGLVVLGGDGTIHEVVNGLLRRADDAATRLALIPAGSGKSIMMHLDCLDPIEAARRIVAGDVKPIDVMRVTTDGEIVHALNIVGWAGVVDINITAERLRVLGPTRYTLAALSHILRAKRRRAKIILDEQTIEDDFTLVIACNTRFTGRGMLAAPEADMSDGKVDVILVRRATRWQFFQMLNKVFNGSHIELPCVELYQVKSFRIEPTSQDPLNLDGEITGLTPVSATVLPGAISVFV